MTLLLKTRKIIIFEQIIVGGGILDESHVIRSSYNHFIIMRTHRWPYGPCENITNGRTDGQTEGPTDGQTRLYRWEDASKKRENYYFRANNCRRRYTRRISCNHIIIQSFHHHEDASLALWALFSWERLRKLRWRKTLGNKAHKANDASS